MPKAAARFADMRKAILGTVALLSAALLLAAGKSISNQAPATLKVAVDVVSLDITVTDSKGHAIAGLGKQDFKIYENDVEQPITFFSPDAAPVSWGLVLDRSGSMEEMMGGVYQAALHVMDEGSPADEMLISTFNDKIRLVSEFSADRHELENSVLGLTAEGSTALYDAVDKGLQFIHDGKHRKKVLVVITDGDDNASHIEFKNLIARVERSPDVLVYTVGMFEKYPWYWHKNQMPPSFQRILHDIAEVTGATAHFPGSVKECRKVMDQIASEVSQQYSLGYYPENRTLDGKWRKIRVEVASQRDKGKKYVVRTRSGYYVPGGPE